MIIFFSTSSAFGLFQMKRKKLPEIHVEASRTTSFNELKKTLALKLPELICENKGYFRTCFIEMKKKCMGVASREIDFCFNNLIQSKKTINESRAERISRDIGGCAGRRFEKNQEHLKMETAVCRDPYAWL